MISKLFEFKLAQKGNSTTEFKSFLKLKRNSRLVMNRFKSNTDVDISQLPEYRDLFVFLEMSIKQLIDISQISRKLESKKIQSLWNIENPKEKSGLAETIVLADNLANTIWVIKLLLSKGIDFQAKILYRYLIEQFDVLVAILGDKSFFQKYVCEHNSEDPSLDFNEKWYKNIRPKKLKNVTSKIYSSTINFKSLGTLMELLKEANYKWLSLYAHGHNQTLEIASFVVKSEGKYYRNNRYCSVDFKVNYTLTSLIVYTGLSLLSIHVLLLKHHKLTNLLDSDTAAKFSNNALIYEDIVMKNLTPLLEDYFSKDSN